MRLRDIVVEVRDKTLKRHGAINHRDLNIKLNNPHNNVGTWSISLSSDHPMAEVLRTPGSGIVVYAKGTEIFSGMTSKPQFTALAADPAGNIVFDGVSDDIILSDMLAWPTPTSALISEQGDGSDTRSGTAESLLHAFVSANVGPAAPAARRDERLVMGPNLNRGAVTKKSARFEVLGEVIGGIANVADLGFRVIQRGNILRFETYAIIDRTPFIRLDVKNNTLQAQKLSVAAPELTHAIVFGKGRERLETDPEGYEIPRSLHIYSSNESLEAADAWGRRIERTFNATSTEDAVELAQAGAEQLADKGYTAVSVQVSPLENQNMNFGDDWGLGDRVAVIVDGDEYVSVVTAFQLRADDTGFYLGAGLGDPEDFDASVALRKRVAKTGARISALERNG